MRLELVDNIRLDIHQMLEKERKQDLGQFMTPACIAKFMASLFQQPKGNINLLDAGAGIGSLTSAFIDRFSELSINGELWELDIKLYNYLSKNINTYSVYSNKLNLKIHNADFIEDVVSRINHFSNSRFTHAILNPPYKKINSHSKHRELLRCVGIETVNLYAAFLALAINLLQTGGEMVAIIPRSFCNGTYYKPFRQFLLETCAIKHIHLFNSRNKAFADDKVLQENIIIYLVKGGSQANITISTSQDSKFFDYHETVYPFHDIVNPNDTELFIHIPVSPTTPIQGYTAAHSLKELNLAVCTGPVVDFRVKEHLSKNLVNNSVPLLYPHHFQKGLLNYPREHKKPNAIFINQETKKWLMPSGFYVLVKRFSSKEERKRVTAYVVNPQELNVTYYGFENHWNVFHQNKQGLEPLLAYGLACFLNSTMVDDNFRRFSGHTQVNATDLRNMKYPTIEMLLTLGKVIQYKSLSQQQIDEAVQTILSIS